MTYVIAELCVDVKDRARVEQCPIDCIDEDTVLPVRSGPSRFPGGAAKLRPLNVNTALVRKVSAHES